MVLASMRTMEPPVDVNPEDSTAVVRSYKPGRASGGMAIVLTGVPPAWLVVCTVPAVATGEGVGAPWPRDVFRCATSAYGPVNDAVSETGTGLAADVGGPGDAIQCTRRTSPGWTT